MSDRKPIPRSVLIFGAGGHIGGPLAAFLAREAPQIRLRLVSSSPARLDALRRAIPDAEAVQADYFSAPSLDAAVAGMEGIFVLTPSGTDEAPAMHNLVAAARQSGSLVQMIRLIGIQPEANDHRIPRSLRDHGLGLPIQHPRAKRILDDSGLPVTYLNSGATFMDNFFGMAPLIRSERRLVWPERKIPYIDPRDIAEVAGRLFLSDNRGHIGQCHTMNNGTDILRFHEIADLMSEAWGVRITHDPGKEAFFAAYPQMGATRLQYLWDFFEYERDNEEVWSRNDFVARILGRKPVTVAAWLREFAHRFAPADNGDDGPAQS